VNKFAQRDKAVRGRRRRARRFETPALLVIDVKLRATERSRRADSGIDQALAVSVAQNPVAINTFASLLIKA
jgi:hypothetical protein